jgi:glutathione S-transferase
VLSFTGFLRRALPDARLAQLHQHRTAQGVFVPLLVKSATPEERAAALARIAKYSSVLSRHLEGAIILEDSFTVADAYLLACSTGASIRGRDRRLAGAARYRTQGCARGRR